MPWNTSTRAARLPHGWQALRRDILNRDAGLCQIRGPNCTLLATEVDHITAGDNHDPTNLHATCHDCHRAKTRREAQAARPTRNRPHEPHPGTASPPLGR